jgi:hypothetical protein
MLQIIFQSMMKHGTEQKGGKNASIHNFIVYRIINISHEYWRLGRISYYNRWICHSILLFGTNRVK